MYISGIFNYCDGWCERCTFTSKCSSYAIRLEEEKMDGTDESRRLFWEAFDSIMEKTVECRSLEDENDDVSSPEMEDDFSEELEDLMNERKDGSKSELFRQAQSYADAARKWINVFESGDNLATDFTKQNTVSTPLSIKLADAIEVVGWYAFFIAVKLARAKSTHRDEWKEVLVHSDENGSAKVALIALNRSIAAWSIIRSFCKEDEIADFLGQLIALRRVVEREFPRAWEFKRPGFDD